MKADYSRRIIPNLIFVFSVLISVNSTPELAAQSEKKFIREGNREYGKGNFEQSELEYRRAVDKNDRSSEAIFNIGDALYRQNKFDEAGKQFIENHNITDDNKKKSASLYNLGNSLLMANQPEKSIEAYKGSLKLDPDNMEAKYNLAYAQDMLIRQEQQKNDQQQQNNEDQNKKDENKDQQNSEDENKNQEQKPNEKDQNQGSEQQISKEDAERLLNALANDEKNVQEKVKLAKANKARVRSVKNW